MGRLSGALCDATLQTSGSASVLEKIERENLFVVPLDMSRRWYRYHHLFGELLRAELHRLEPDLVAGLHRRAAAWFQAEGLVDEAVRHLVAAGDIAGSADLIAADWVNEFNGGGLSTVSGWLDLLADQTVSRDPRLSAARAWIALHVGQFDDAQMWIEAVEAGSAADALDHDALDHGTLDHGTLDHGALEAQLVALREVHAFKTGDLAAALLAARRAITLDFGDALHAQSVAYCVYGSALYFSGDIDDARGALRAAVSLAEEVGNPLARRYGLGYLAMISAYQGQLAEAEDLIRCATGSGRDLADGEHFVEVMVSLAAAIVLDMRGDVAAAVEAAEMAVGLARKGAGVLEVANALLARGEILAHLGEHATAAASRDEAATLLGRCADAGVVGRLRSVSQRGAGVAVSARTQTCALGEELTAKECEVLGLLVTRLSRREIGQRLYVSLNTVKTHQRALYRKLGVEDRNAAVSRARELGLL